MNNQTTHTEDRRSPMNMPVRPEPKIEKTIDKDGKITLVIDGVTVIRPPSDKRDPGVVNALNRHYAARQACRVFQ